MVLVCTRCGTDCSRLRAPPDPVYALPLVVCPGCGACVVRRRLIQRWSRTGGRALICAIGAGVWRLVALLVLSGLSVGVAVVGAAMIRHAMPRGRSRALSGAMWNDWLSIGGPIWLAGSLLAMVLIVVAMRLVLAHLGTAARAATLCGCVVLVAWAVPNGVNAMRSLANVGSMSRGGTVYQYPHEAFRLELGDWLWAAHIAVLGVLFFAARPLVDRLAGRVAGDTRRSALARRRRRKERQRR